MRMKIMIACLGMAVGLALGSVQPTWAQNKTPIIKNGNYPTQYFRSPLDIPHQASGTFGELRSTHFHAGDDYRTQQRVGLPLYAVAEGYVSRIRIQAGGGGHSMYITHPNGFTSVYLHMHEFGAKYKKVVREAQYAQKSFEVDLKFGPETFPIKKGERFGTTGNSGSSEGPHLHFEIRDTETEEPINPQLFGLHFPDQQPPLIQSIMIYDLGEGPFSHETPRRPFKTIAKGGGTFALEKEVTIPVNGRFGIGIQTVDKHNGTTFNNGVYSIELLAANEPVSTVVFERLSFATSGTIHAYIDYPYYSKTRTRIQKSFKDPNNPIQLFYSLKGDGSLHTDDIAQLSKDKIQGPITLQYRVRDVHGNTSSLSFKVKYDPNYQPNNTRTPGTSMFRYAQENIFEAENISVIVPENALYDDLYFNYSQGPKPEGAYALMQHVHTNEMPPLQKAYILKIKPDETLPASLYDKALIVNEQGNAVGGKYENGWVSTQTRNFGKYTIKVDTIPPTIQAVNVSPAKNLANQSKISFRISDNLSGIASYNAYIDGQWVLMQYDPKNRLLWHDIEPQLSKGKHQFKLEVRDGKDNLKVYEFQFTR